MTSASGCSAVTDRVLLVNANRRYGRVTLRPVYRRSPHRTGPLRVLAGGGERSINVEGSYRHILTDLYAFIGTAVAAIVILATGFDRADPIASLFVVALMLHSAWILLRASGRVFMEASPAGIDPAEIGEALVAAEGVVEVHDLHVWGVTSGFPALSAHVLVTRECDCHDARRRLERMLAERFDLTHTTLQMEHEEPQLLQVEDAIET